MFCGLSKSKTSDDERGCYKQTGKNGQKRVKNEKNNDCSLEQTQEKEVSELAVSNEMLMKENDELRKINENLASEVQTLRDDFELYKGEVMNLKRTNAGKKENVRALEVMLSELKIRNTDLVMQAECSQRRLLETEEAEIRLQMDLAREVELNGHLQDDNSSLRRDKEAFTERSNQFSSLAKTKEALERSLVEKTRRNLNLERIVYCLNRSISEDLKQLGALPEAIISENIDLKRYIQQGVDKVQETLDTQHKHAMKRLDTMLNAWSHFLEVDTDLDISQSPSGNRRIPAYLRAAATRLSCNLGPNWVEAGRLLNLTGEELEKICMDWSQYGMKELALQVVEHWCCADVDNATLESLETAMAEMEMNPLELDPMPESHVTTLQENYPDLIEQMMDVSLLEPHLRQAHVISRAACEYILDPRTRYGRIRRLLKVLPFCGARALPVFRNALINTRQQHLAQKLTGLNQRDPLPITEIDSTEVVTRTLEMRATHLQEKAEDLTELNKLNFRCAVETKCEVLKVREKLDKFRFNDDIHSPTKSRRISEGIVTIGYMDGSDKLPGTMTL